MTTHTVAKDENLSVIAAKHGFKNWRIIYYAAGNEAFRQRRPDPDLIQPGDVVAIPERSEIAFIDTRSHVQYNNIPLVTQSELTCWKACGRMLYLWKHPREVAGFERLAGPFLTRETGLKTIDDWVEFYSRRLKLLGTYVGNWNFLFNIVASRGPAIVAKFTDNIQDTHAMIMAGYNLKRGEMFLLDPAAGETFTFDEQGNAAFTAGPATLDNMGHWHKIARTRLRNEVFHW